MHALCSGAPLLTVEFGVSFALVADPLDGSLMLINMLSRTDLLG